MARRRQRAQSVEREELELVTPKARPSFVNFLKPKAFEDGDPEFSCLLVLEEDHAFWDKLRDKMELALEGKFGEVPGRWTDPIRETDDVDYFDEEQEGMLFCRIKSDRKPEIVDEDFEELITASDVYSGAYYKIACHVYAWQYGGKKGCTLELDNVMKVDDGEPFGGKKATAAESFANAVDDDDEKPRRRGRKSRGRGRDRERGGRRSRRSSALD